MKLREVLNHVYSNEDFSGILENCTVQKVEVRRNQNKWIIYLKASSMIEEKLLASAAEKIKSACRQVDEVCFHINYQLSISLQEFCSKWFTSVAKSLEQHHSFLKGWLTMAHWEVQGNRLILQLPSRMGVEFLYRKKSDQLIAAWIQERYGLECSIEFQSKPELLEMIKQNQAHVENNYLRDLVEKANISAQQELSSANSSRGIDEIIIGKKITGPVKDLVNLTDEEKLVIVKGKVFGYGERDLRSGRKLITFNITDNTDSVAVKVFTNNEKGELNDHLKEGQWVLVRGPVQYDKRSQELTLFATDINRLEYLGRQDNSERKRVELHLHTKMSAMDGLTDTTAVIKKAAEWGHPAIAITDHGVVQAFPEAFEAGKRWGVKIIYGVEGYLVDDIKQGAAEKAKNYHIILLVKNAQGLRNLYKLISLSHLDYFYRKPRIPRNELIKYREGLIVGSACEAGELIQSYLQGIRGQQLAAIAEFYDYLEIQPVGNNLFLVRNGTLGSEEQLRTMIKDIYCLGKLLGKPVVATGDVHFLEPDDAIYRQILQAGQGYEDESQAPLFFRTTDEMLAEFSYLGPSEAEEVVIDYPQQVAAMVEDIKPIPDQFFPPEIQGAEEQITQMAWENAKRIYGEQLPGIVEKRLTKELDSIINNGFAVLYLIAHKLVKKSNEDGYMVGSRGSVGSSFVATLTGITEVNPLPPHYVCPSCKFSQFFTDGSYDSGADLPDKTCPSCGIQLKKDGHQIPFEVFLGFKGDKVPDIDLNFSGEYQPIAHKYVEELFGTEHVFRAGTIATIAERTAFGFVKKYLTEKDIVKRSVEIERLVAGCTGVKRTTGQHPGGLMVVPQNMDVHYFTPLQRPADDQKSQTITTHFDYHAISSRLVKLDILGHDDPTVIRMLEDITGINAREIPLDDHETMKIFSGVEVLGVKPEDIGSKVGTFGIPEFGTRFVRQMLEETKPKTFSELVRISGFSHGSDVWLNNAQELIRKKIATLSEAIACRDDIMTFLIQKGLPPDVAFKVMEDVRKGKGLKPEHEQLLREKQIPQWYIESCQKIKYMFPKAHAVAYVTMAFRIAYFKVRYPEAFYASFFTVRADEFDADLICQGKEKVKQKIEEIEKMGNQATAKDKNLLTILEVALEMMQRGISLLPVSLEESAAREFLITKQGIMPPFCALQGVGTAAAEAIVKARAEKPFTSVEDLHFRSRISKTVLETLSNHGCLDKLPTTSQIAFF